MWIILAFSSAVLLGIYDVFKKKALKNNAVLPVLFLNTLFSSLLFLPLILLSKSTALLDNSIFFVNQSSFTEQLYIILKSIIVLSSWICGYYAMKHLPLTIVGPINTMRPVMVLIAAMLIFAERLNIYQWIGVSFAIMSFFLLSRTGKKERIDFKSNKWIFLLLLATILGAISGLYDKYLLAPESAGGKGFHQVALQSWYTIYQCIMMGIVLMVLWFPKQKQLTSFRWSWYILGISLALSIADFLYYYSISEPTAMIAIVSMIRRSSVLVSFGFGAFILKENNLRGKILDLLLILIGMIFLCIGS